jgi:hypothetical protein
MPTRGLPTQQPMLLWRWHEGPTVACGRRTRARSDQCKEGIRCLVYVYRTGGCARTRAELWPRAWAVARGRRSDRWTLEATAAGLRSADAVGAPTHAPPTRLAEAEGDDGGGTGGREPLRTRPRTTLPGVLVGMADHCG